VFLLINSHCTGNSGRTIVDSVFENFLIGDRNPLAQLWYDAQLNQTIPFWWPKKPDGYWCAPVRTAAVRKVQWLKQLAKSGGLKLV
jgi:hypothetical protein